MSSLDFKRAAYALVATAALVGCAQKPTGPEATGALIDTLKAQTMISGKTVGQLPVGTAVTTIFDDSSQILIAKKVANGGNDNCGKFDIMTHRPSSGNGFEGMFSHGDTSKVKAVEVCIL